jgi:hypothetical protein
VQRLVERGGARATFELVRAVAQADEALRQVAGDAGVRYPVAEPLRREAGFSDAEIETVKALPGR